MVLHLLNWSFNTIILLEREYESVAVVDCVEQTECNDILYD